MNVGIDDQRFRKLLHAYPMEAIELLYDLFYKKLFSIAVKLTQDSNAARDIVHDTFLTIWDKRKQVSKGHEKSIEHYLTRIVRNKSVSHFKRRKHLSLEDLIYMKSVTIEENPVEAKLINAELRIELRKVIATFPKREQECILMKIDGELSLDQIAAELKVSRKMVEKCQTKAMKRLRKWAAGIQKDPPKIFR